AIAASGTILPFGNCFLAALYVRRRKAAFGAAGLACGAGGAASGAIQGN
ncbi:hypothetical protein A2U01_0085943, partial [Trifolium medium]|nr:hypothetical protein [Trifolium medium]